MSDAKKTLFGTMPEGEPVEQYILEAGQLRCGILTYGGALRFLEAPDREGNPTDVLLGFDTLEDYRRQDKYIGALIGRFANRIGGARFTLDGKAYPLAANDGNNHLHGGLQGFDKRVWTVEEAGRNFLTLSLTSPDGEEGYPGSLSVRVSYSLSEKELSIHYQAESGAPTVCNLTSHAYFNLSGHHSGPVLDQTIQILAEEYTPAGGGSIPTGEISSVAGTPMDLRAPLAIGERIDEGFPQLVQAGGYDHNWALSGGVQREPRLFARAVSPASGIAMEALTTLPGVQFYSGNYLDGCPKGKGGAPYGKRWGFCLETQFFPDTPNRGAFPSCRLNPGEIWDHTTVYRFSTV